ncbi:hypothetical protein [Nonomuraea rhodomycinica]|nr:hypothetical protein [Nonomuraea rhodomycinica]
MLGSLTKGGNREWRHFRRETRRRGRRQARRELRARPGAERN